MPASLPERVDDFVRWLFQGHQNRVPRGPKVFNDALLGNQHFSRHEVAVIDSPLLQRLKRIKQTGLVNHVFPSATHSRFEHSLGAASLADRCFTAIANRHSAEHGQPLPVDQDRVKGDLAHLRMAALLHDVGHGLCSHASEQIYSMLSDLKEFRSDPKFVKNAPGEILSYLMVNSAPFKEWFNDIVVGGCGAAIDLELVGQMILGKHPRKELYFLSQIVSSPFDADKLDYIARDSYYCGLALTVDLGRFYSMISTEEVNGYRVLVLRSYIPLEQIFFSRMILFSSVYHHQKVKCLDSMLRNVVRHIHDHPRECALSIRDKRISFAEPVEYLYVTDDEFFNQAAGFGDAYVKGMLDRFWRRDLFSRCVEMSRLTVRNWPTHNRKTLIDLASGADALESIETDIYERLPRDVRAQCHRREVSLSVPGLPSLKSDYAFIQTSSSAPPAPVEQFFPLEQWTDSYAHNKWRSFVYAPRQFAAPVAEAAIGALADRGIEIDADISRRECRL